MAFQIDLHCTCGQVHLHLDAAPFLVVECCCESCRLAAARLEAMDGAPTMTTAFGTTPFAEVRKDRLSFVRGRQSLKEFRLKPDSRARRVIAACCNTPVFLESNGAHWLSLYLHLWPQGIRPVPQFRIMAIDFPDPAELPNDLPNLRTHSLGIFARLFAVWIAMRFRNPEVSIEGTLDV